MCRASNKETSSFYSIDARNPSSPNSTIVLFSNKPQTVQDYYHIFSIPVRPFATCLFKKVIPQNFCKIKVKKRPKIPVRNMYVTHLRCIKLRYKRIIKINHIILLLKDKCWGLLNMSRTIVLQYPLVRRYTPRIPRHCAEPEWTILPLNQVGDVQSRPETFT